MHLVVWKSHSMWQNTWRWVSALLTVVLCVQHLADPINTSIFSKAVIAPGVISQPACQIPPVTNFEVQFVIEDFYFVQ